MSPVNILLLIVYSPRACNHSPSILHTLTLKVNTTALVAEVFPASALHMIAALGFFNPKFAERTHLVLGAFHKLLKSFFILIGVSWRLIFFAGKTSVIKSSALETIAFVALDTSEVIAIYSCIVDESVGAVRGRAPWNIVLDSYSLKEGVLLIFFHILRWKNSIHVSWCKVYLAVWQRTQYWTLWIFNLCLKIAPHAFLMKDMLTIRKHTEILLQLLKTHHALMWAFTHYCFYLLVFI